MILVDGKALAENILNEVATRVSEFGVSPHLVVFTCAPNFETQKYLKLKQDRAQSLGIDMTVDELPVTSTTKDIVMSIEGALNQSTGVVVQLPLPVHIDTAAVLAAVPSTHDVDAFSYSGGVGEVLPPVVGAIAKIADIYGVSWKGKQVAVFGQGRLVGMPAALYAKSAGAEVSIITEASHDVDVIAKSADIVILGVGQPNLLTPDMVKEGVVVFDAGASEDGGLLVGDADPAVVEKASLFTPVPGGIGPMTIALLFHNLVELQKRQ
jgi:methylenetetrahydrofolate dehydrogenase (NADP+)/methenyltetrahydrofolate cyclohydrolase